MPAPGRRSDGAKVKERPFRLRGSVQLTRAKPLNDVLTSTAERVLALQKLDRLYRELPPAADCRSLAREVLTVFDVGRAHRQRSLRFTWS